MAHKKRPDLSGKTHTLRDWMQTLLFFGILAFFLIGSLLLPDAGFSKSERRKLASAPKWSLEAIMNGSAQVQLESYASDQLIGREALLKLVSLSRIALYQNLDDEGMISKDGSLIKVERQISEDSLNHAADVFASIYEKNLKNTKCKIYFSIIPDKSYFLENGQYLNMDYAAFFEKAEQILGFGQNIPIADTLSLNDYYYTDPHWRQEKLLDTVRTLAKGMHVSILEDYSTKEVLKDFIGQSGGLTMLPHDQDSLQVLWNDSMKDWRVYRYDTGKPVKAELYDVDKANGLDPYQLFLGGSSGLIEIDNPLADSSRQLVVFADSYGSSLVPLLASGYGQTMLVDLRNLPSWRLKDVIDFTNQEVLFLYSTSVLNASEALK